MGYRNAWGLIQGLQETFRAQVVATATGGVAGGGTKLTTLGTELLASYRRIEERAGSAVRADMSQLSGMLHSGQASKIPTAELPPGCDRRATLARSPRLSLRKKSR
jgi:molybdate transport system regulatory protein